MALAIKPKHSEIPLTYSELTQRGARIEELSEELSQKQLTEHGLFLGSYEYYNVGNTTLKQLKKHKIIPNKNYKKYEPRRPDGLLVDRRNKSEIRVICVIEHKDKEEFDTPAKRKNAVEECNDLCQELNAKIGIATDTTSYIWFNPNQKYLKNEYKDRTTGKKRSYTIIKEEDGNDFVREFVINQKEDEIDLKKLKPRTKRSLESVEEILLSISSDNSQLSKPTPIDPTSLATQIWQDVWSASGATPEKCLYTFLELFIFKYLSDLNILTKDKKGNKINFRDIIALDETEAFSNYSDNVRPYLKEMFPQDKEDNTTIINGTVLNPKILGHSRVFYKILKRFQQFGELKEIDPSFKSKVFEEFMKENISKKSWGQFFTPRSIVDAIIEMSDVDKLERGAKICDPACGVGGFILEPMKVKNDGVNFYYKIEGRNIIPRYDFYGYDRGFENEEQLVIILAKANMLIFLSDLLKKNPTLSTEFAKLFNRTFKLLRHSYSILGTLSITDEDKYDLILTNPPYVASGSSNYKEEIKRDSRLSNFYTVSGLGLESLFLQWIIRSLKPEKKAFVIIPDGILSRVHGDKLREFIKKECVVDGIISLPVNAFYRNLEKTYILAITKKEESTPQEREEHKQTEPVFTYLVSNIGETLDVKRFPTPEENDLKEMVSLFNQFKGSKSSFKTDSKRCKIQPIEKFNPNDVWLVDRWWSKDEKIELKIEEKETIMTLDQFKEKVNDIESRLHQLSSEIESLI